MSGRKVLGLAVLVAWALTLGWHVRREYFAPAAERLAEAARRLPPGVAYYALYRGHRRAGWGQMELDTLPGATGFQLTRILHLRLPSLGAAGESEVRLAARLGPSLDLVAFELANLTPRGSLHVRGSVGPDSVLRVETARISVRAAAPEAAPRESPAADGAAVAEDGVQAPDSATAADTLRLRVDPRITLAEVWPLRLAARGAAEPGDHFAAAVFDPIALAERSMDIRVLEREIRTYADSASRAPEGVAWFAARRDTVLAWRVRRVVGGAAFEAWIDADGRVLEAEIPGGLHMRRTAFELAFYADAETGDR